MGGPKFVYSDEAQAELRKAQRANVWVLPAFAPVLIAVALGVGATVGLSLLAVAVLGGGIASFRQVVLFRKALRRMKAERLAQRS